MRHLLRAIVIALCPFGYLDAARHAATTEEGARRGIYHPESVYQQEIIVESHRQRVGLHAPPAVLVHGHLILLAANICLQAFHIGSVATEISTVVLVDTREVAAVHIGGGCHCVLPHIIGRRKFNAHQVECLCRIAASQHPVTGSIEVKMVGSAAQPLGGDNSAVLYHLRQHSNYLVHACTNTTVVGIHHFTGNQGHLVSLQMKVSKQVVVYALHLLGPLLVTGVRLALM